MGKDKLKIRAHTQNGLKFVKAKINGENIVPLGYMDDDGDILFALKKHLYCTVMPLLYKIYYKVISDFKINESSIKINLFTGKHYTIHENNSLTFSKKIIQSNSLLHFFKELLSVIDNNDQSDFSMFLNIDCVKSDKTSFGTQIEILLDFETYDNEEADDSWKVWILRMESVDINLEKSISKKKEKKIINEVFEHLWFSYNNPD